MFAADAGTGRDASTDADADDDAPGGDATAGSRVVYAIYAVSVATAGVFGFVLGFVLDAGDVTGSFGPVSFALTPLNLAIFGMVMVGASLGVGLALVRAVSRRAA